MIYSNDDLMAILVMEAERTGNYGEDSYESESDDKCPVCGAYNPNNFYINDDECVGCSECIAVTYSL